MEKYGLIGRNISYSFSKSFFTEKFASEGINAVYENFDIQDIEEFFQIKKTPSLRGLNVTIPFKEAIIPFLDNLSKHAAEIGAVNTIKFEQNGQLTGYNTDFIGFAESLKPLLLPQHKKALILGTGGASKAVAYAFKQLNIDFLFVSRNKKSSAILYSEINEELLNEYQIIINCTPLGTFPNVEETPPFPVDFLNSKNLVMDLIYNPKTTKLLQLAKEKGATIFNGAQMLQIQAEEAWKIWNTSN